MLQSELKELYVGELKDIYSASPSLTSERTRDMPKHPGPPRIRPRPMDVARCPISALLAHPHRLNAIVDSVTMTVVVPR